jgi:hypothetical protein
VDRAKVVLETMVDAGTLTPAQAAAVNLKTVHLAAEQGQNSARYFTDWVLPQLDVLVPDNDQPIEVWTTLDPVAQRAATDAIAAQVPKGAQGALVSVDRDGAVLAMVGGTDYVTSNYNRATNAVRQPGSAWKLFVYLAALERGYRPEDRVVDEPVTIDGWSPRNSGGNYAGQIDVRTAFAYSKNTVAAQLGNEVGFDAVANMARRFGITTPINTMPSMVLGTSDVRVIDMVRAFASVEAKGKLVTPYGIRKVTTTDGEVLYSHRPDAAAARARLCRGRDHRPVADGGQHRHRPRGADRPPGGGQDRHHQFQQGWLVPGLFQRRDDRRVDGPRRCASGARPRAAPRRRAPLPPICGWPRPSARSNSSTTSSSCPNGNWSRTTRPAQQPQRLLLHRRERQHVNGQQGDGLDDQGSRPEPGRASRRAARPTMPSPSTRMAWACGPPPRGQAWRARLRPRAMRNRRRAMTCSIAPPGARIRPLRRVPWRPGLRHFPAACPVAGAGVAGLLEEGAAFLRSVDGLNGAGG